MPKTIARLYLGHGVQSSRCSQSSMVQVKNSTVLGLHSSTNTKVCGGMTVPLSTSVHKCDNTLQKRMYQGTKWASVTGRPFTDKTRVRGGCAPPAYAPQSKASLLHTIRAGR